MKIKYSIALVLLLGTVTSSRAQYEEISTDEPSYEYEYEDTTQPYVIPEEATTTTTCGPTTTTTTTCEPTTTTPKPTRTTTPKPTRTTTPKPTTKPPPSWKAGVDEHVGKCKAALKFFVGPTYRTAKTILDAFLCLIPKLESSTGSRSQIIRIKSTEILDTISVMTEVGNSPRGILNGFEGVLHFVCQSYRTIVSSMESDIGVSTSDVTNAMTDLEVSLYGIIADYKRCHTLHICDDSIDQKPVLKSIQKLTNAVACVSELALKNCENDDANVRESLYILMLIFDHLVICGHATNVSIAAELNVRCKGISNPWSQCLKVIDNLLGGITEALNAVVNTVLEAVISLVKAIVNLAKCLNDVLKSVFDLVENVTQNLTKTVSSTLKGVTGSLSNILKIGK